MAIIPNEITIHVIPNDLKLYKVDFEPIYSVGCCLVILAESKEEATEIAKKTIKHKTSIFEVSEVEPKKGVIVYLSGDY